MSGFPCQSPVGEKICRAAYFAAALIIMLFVLNACIRTKCIDFENPPMGQVYRVGDTFIDSGVAITVLPFQWGNGTWTNNGFAKVENGGRAGGSGQDIHLNNVNLGFKISAPFKKLTMLFGEYGGNLNIDVNGDFKNFQNFANLNTTLVGGANAAVVNGLGNDMGTLDMSGTMNQFDFQEKTFAFIVGGQELWVDHVCTVK
jgi:hypothetical protein